LLQVLPLEICKTFNGQADAHGRLPINGPAAPPFAWLTERAAVNLVRLRRPELEPLRRSAVWACLGDFCVLDCGLEAATGLCADVARRGGRGVRCPTLVTAADGARVLSGGAIEVGRDSECPPLEALPTHLGTHNPAPRRVAALEALRVAAAARRTAAGAGGGGCHAALRAELERVAAREQELVAQYRAERAARVVAGSGQPAGTALSAAGGDPPALEAAGPDGEVVCGAAGADGVFVTPEARLRQGVGTREGGYAVRYSVRASAGGGGRVGSGSAGPEST
jgi:hypothetical protein